MVSSPGMTPKGDRFGIIYEGRAYSDRFYSDHLGSLYFIDNHKIIKVETPTDEIFEYGSLSEGSITSADFSNPLQILVFYREFNKVAFLDNKLAALRSQIKLSDIGIDQASLVCSSGRGGIWVFEDREERLIYFDRQLRLSHQGNILSTVTGPGLKPVYMVENQNNLFMNIPGHGIAVFDRFASYHKTIPYKGPEVFRVSGDRIIYFSQGKLVSIDVETGEEGSLPLPAGVEIKDADISRNNLILLTGNGIRIYRVKIDPHKRTFN